MDTFKVPNPVVKPTFKRRFLKPGSLKSLEKKQAKEIDKPPKPVPLSGKLVVIGPTHLNFRFRKALILLGQLGDQYIVQLRTVDDYKKHQDSHEPRRRYNYAAVLHDCDKTFTLDMLKDAAKKVVNSEGSTRATTHFFCRYKNRPGKPNFPDYQDVKTTITKLNLSTRRLYFDRPKEMAIMARYCTLRFRSYSHFRNMAKQNLTQAAQP